MTQTIDPPEASPPVADLPHFQIDPSWFAENGLSFESIVRDRTCASCRPKLGQLSDERVPIFDPKTGRMHMESQKVTFGSDPIKLISDHCGHAPNYITRDMPTLEAVFRVLLANGNRPSTLPTIREQLTEWCPGGGCQWLLLPVETIERLINHDTYYGLRRVVDQPGG